MLQNVDVSKPDMRQWERKPELNQFRRWFWKKKTSWILCSIRRRYCHHFIGFRSIASKTQLNFSIIDALSIQNNAKHFVNLQHLLRVGDFPLVRDWCVVARQGNAVCVNVSIDVCHHEWNTLKSNTFYMCIDLKTRRAYCFGCLATTFQCGILVGIVNQRGQRCPKLVGIAVVDDFKPICGFSVSSVVFSNHLPLFHWY